MEITLSNEDNSYHFILNTYDQRVKMNKTLQLKMLETEKEHKEVRAIKIKFSIKCSKVLKIRMLDMKM